MPENEMPVDRSAKTVTLYFDEELGGRRKYVRGVLEGEGDTLVLRPLEVGTAKPEVVYYEGYVDVAGKYHAGYEKEELRETKYWQLPAGDTPDEVGKINYLRSNTFTLFQLPVKETAEGIVLDENRESNGRKDYAARAGLGPIRFAMDYGSNPVLPVNPAPANNVGEPLFVEYGAPGMNMRFSRVLRDYSDMRDAFVRDIIAERTGEDIGFQADGEKRALNRAQKEEIIKNMDAFAVLVAGAEQAKFESERYAVAGNGEFLLIDRPSQLQPGRGQGDDVAKSYIRNATLEGMTVEDPESGKKSFIVTRMHYRSSPDTVTSRPLQLRIPLDESGKPAIDSKHPAFLLIKDAFRQAEEEISPKSGRASAMPVESALVDLGSFAASSTPGKRHGSLGHDVSV
jgi:hypothetical protein